jgi:hypothetical protein
MDFFSDNEADPPVLTEYIRLPDMVPLPDPYAQIMRGPAPYLEPGLYDAHGKKLGGLKETIPEARVVIEFAGVSLVWGVFSVPLLAGQRGDMIFTNVPGTGPQTPFFNEWDTAACLPRVGEALFTLIACQRGRGVTKVVGRNTYGADLHAAAGFIVSALVNMPGDEPTA